MKKLKYFLFVLFSFNVLLGQRIVRFENNVFTVDGAPFFPMGWYDCSISDFDNIRVNSSGKPASNVVLPYWSTITSCSNPSPSSYLNTLQSYLNEADSKNLMVIVEIPARYYNSSCDATGAIPEVNPSGYTHDDYISTIVNGLENHHALLGWYIIDEPEQTPPWFSVSTLEHWYSYTKQEDDYKHPIFFCYGTAKPSDAVPIYGIDELHSFNNWCPTPTNNMYDVLLEDHYVIINGNPEPSPNLVYADLSMQSLFERFQFDNKNETSATTIRVNQGYGSWGMRNPNPLEIKYEAFNYFYTAQQDNISNAGGLLFWRYNVSNSTLQDNIKNFIIFFRDNNLDIVIRQSNLNWLVTSNLSQVKTFLRYYDGNFYLFAVNQSGDVANNTNFKLKIGAIGNCDELNVDLTTSNISNIQGPTLEGCYSFSDDLSAREAKVYRIASTDIIFSSSDLNLSNKTINNPTKETYLTSNSISAGTSYVVNGGKVIFLAKETISLLPGFTVNVGGAFESYVSSGLSPILQQTSGSSMSKSHQGLEFPADQKLSQKIPKEFYLFYNYPNPFNPTTIISYGIPKNTNVQLKIFDILGREVAILVNEYQSAGFKTVSFNASSLPSGTYFYQLNTQDNTTTRKMFLLK